MRARCMVCRADLEARPVLRAVRNGRHPSPGGTFQKRVNMKPAQLVIACRSEGSLNAQYLPPDIDRWEVRICGDCLQGRSWSEVLAVALDRRLESGE